MASVVSVHVADVGVGAGLRLLRRRLRPESVNGLRHADLAAATPLSASVLPRPAFGRIALIGFWDDDEALDRFVRAHPLASRLGGGWHARLAPLRRFGSWPGLADDISDSRHTTYDGPAVVLTLGRLRLTQAGRFLRASAEGRRGRHRRTGLALGDRARPAAVRRDLLAVEIHPGAGDLCLRTSRPRPSRCHRRRRGQGVPPPVGVRAPPAVPRRRRPRRTQPTGRARPRRPAERAPPALSRTLTPGTSRYVQESICSPYADQGDAWIDEDSEVEHVGLFAAAGAVEAAAARFGAPGGDGVVLRFAQFYSADSEHVRAFNGWARRRINPFLGDPGSYWSFVHADDAGAAVAAALTIPGGVYNVGDDEPVTRADAGRIVADALGVQPPRSIPRLLRLATPPSAKALMRSLRVSNRRFRDASGWAGPPLDARLLAAGWTALTGTRARRAIPNRNRGSACSTRSWARPAARSATSRACEAVSSRSRASPSGPSRSAPSAPPIPPVDPAR